MNTLTCKNCGSSEFNKIKEIYTCQHCGTSIVPKVHFSKTRIKLILILLVFLSIISIFIYKMLYTVDEKMNQLNTNTQMVSSDVSRGASTISKINQTIKAKIEKELGHFPLEDALNKYHNEATKKAFFISLNKDGKYSYGFTTAQGSTKEATQKAFSICEKERLMRNLDEICIPYIINEKISPNIAE